MKKIAIIGVGHMGGAILTGLAKTKKYQLLAENHVNKRVSQLTDKYNCQLVYSISDLAKLIPDLVVITTPAAATMEIVQKLTILNKDTIIVSAAAGHSLKDYQAKLAGYQIARCIPNIPVSVNSGLTGIYYPNDLAPAAKDFINEVFHDLGEVVEVAEEQLSIVGTIAGCGPAFVDVFMDALADSGVLNGLARELANQIAAGMVKGAAQLALDSHLHPALLKDQVCSPGGTTIKGVTSLEENGFRHAVIEAVNAANQN